MKPAEKTRAIMHQTFQAFKSAAFRGKSGDTGAYDVDAYPRTILDIILFHKLHLAMTAEEALRSYRELRQEFVDWNEVRVSSVREIQEHLRGSPSPLELAVFIKDLLEFVHRERHELSLEFLAEENLTTIRQFFKPVKGLDGSTVELVLRLRKEHPVLPLSAAAEVVLERLGLVPRNRTRDQKQKQLHKLVDPAKALWVHHFLLDHGRGTCPPEEERVDCPHCGMRRFCAYYGRRNGRSVVRRAAGAKSKVIRKAVAAKRVRSSTARRR